MQHAPIKAANRPPGQLGEGSWFLVLGSWFLVLGWLLAASTHPPEKNQEPRTKNQEPRTKNQEPRTKNLSPTISHFPPRPRPPGALSFIINMLNQTLSRPPANPHPHRLTPHQHAIHTAADMAYADQTTVIDHPNQYPETLLTDGHGRRYLVLGQPLGADPALQPPFRVTAERNSNTSTWRLRIQPGSIIHAWDSAHAQFPTVRGRPNTLANPATLPLDPGNGWRLLQARIELNPLPIETEPGYWEIGGAETLTPWDLDFHTEPADARLMQINPATGDVLQTGIYYRPLAEITLTGAGTDEEEVLIAQHALGPWSVKLCGASLTVLPGPVAFYRE